MATMKQTGGERKLIASWVTPKFAREVKELAADDRRSVSSLIRIALEDRLHASPPAGEEAPGGSSPRSPAEAPTSKER